MIIYTDKALEELIKNKGSCSYEQEPFSELIGYLTGESDHRVMVINNFHGINEADMMMQAIAGHIGTDDTMYIKCQTSDKTNDIADVIRASKKRYIFLDNVTDMSDFIDMASVYSDESACMGHKVVMTGTDPAAFAAVRGGELFDRMREIRIT